MRLTQNKSISVVLLDRLMTDLENRNISYESSSNELIKTKPTTTERLYIELFGKIIQQVSKISQNFYIFFLFLRLMCFSFL